MSLITLIVIHRSPGQLPDCLEAMRACTGGEYRLVVMDATNGRDRDVEDQLPGNGGWAPQVISLNGEKDTLKNINRVLKQSEWDQVFFIESAVRVVNGWIETLGNCLATASQVGLVGPLMEEHYHGLPRQAINPAVSCNDLNAALQVRHKGQRVAVRNPWSGCLGGALATLKALGYLDEACQDIDVALADLCLRAEMAGYQNYLVGDIYVGAAKRPPLQRGRKGLRDKWESLDPESDPRKHYEALHLCHRAHQAHLREEFESAVELYLKGIGLYPGEPKLYLDLATLLVEAGQYADALETLKEMPVEGPLEKRDLLVGNCQRKMGQTDAADRTIASILANDARSAAGWWLKGACLADRGAIDQAREALEQSIACDPGFGTTYRLLGNLATKTGNGENALELFERGFALSLTAETAADYHTVVSQKQVFQRAIPFFTQALAIYPSSRRLRYLLIDLLLKTGQHGAAMDTIESTLAVFGVEEGLLNAALTVREQLGPRVIAAAENTPATLAFCLIVKNEERDLPRCLESIKPVADEIVVVDTGSRDRTRKLAQVFGARVFDFKWCDDFAAAKNFAAARAEAEWIFSIDADEVLGAQDYGALKALIKSGAYGSVAYAVTTRNYLKVADVIGWQPNDGRYPEEAGLGWMPSEKVRLFPNDPRVRFSYPVHEMVEPSLTEAGIRIVACDIPVHHYGKLDQARCLAKGRSYFKIGIQKLESMQSSATGLRELAVQAQTLGDYAEAVQLWKRLLELEPDKVPSYINLAGAYLETGNYAASLKAARQAHRLDPALKESHFNLAMSMLFIGDAFGAADVLQKVVTKHPEYLAANFLLAASCSCTGEDSRAKTLIDELQRTSLGAGIEEALRHLAEKLAMAGQDHYCRSILELAG